MCRFIFVIFLTALAGGAGGLANYLLLTPPSSEQRRFSGAARFASAGAIVAFVVPLFLSLAQSSLVKGIFDYSGVGQDYSDVLIFAGFCVVAGFASRAFMDNMTAKMMQMQQEVRQAKNEARQAENKAVEAIELTEENSDRVAEAAVRSDGIHEVPHSPAGSNARATHQSLSPVATAIAAGLNPVEREVLSAMSRYSKRTQTGVARDAKVPRNQVGEVIDHLRDRGVIHFTTSANTGGPRVQLTQLGIETLNALEPKIVITDSVPRTTADPIPGQEE